MALGFLGNNPILNALPRHGAQTSFRCKCVLIGQMIYSFFPIPHICFPLKMFLLEVPGTKFSKIEHTWKPSDSASALQYTVRFYIYIYFFIFFFIYFFATKPETKMPPYTTISNLYSKHPRPVLLSDHHILSHWAWAQPQNLSQHSAGSHSYHRLELGCS